MPIDRPASTSARTWDAPARSAVQERFYRDLMGSDHLPSAPEVAQRMLTTVNRENATLEDLRSVIVRDQSLAARLLSLANSAFFASRARITSIPQAITLLGFGRVRDLALSLSVWRSLDARDPVGRRHRSGLWTHTASVAGAAKLLAERTGGDGDTAFTAGLLHDVGKLVLGLRLGASYWDLLEEARVNEQSAAEVETEAFGCHHATVGGWLLQLWQLPPALVDPVALHHDSLLPQFGFDVAAAVAVANRLIDATNPSTGVARGDVLAEIRTFAPGLLDSAEWPGLYGAVAKEQQAIGGIFAN